MFAAADEMCGRPAFTVVALLGWIQRLVMAALAAMFRGSKVAAVRSLAVRYGISPDITVAVNKNAPVRSNPICAATSTRTRMESSQFGLHAPK